jgi:hypothetical protein
MAEETFLDEATRQADLALEMSDAWARPLPDGVRLKRVRSLLAKALEVYTARQTEFDKAMLVAVFALVEELRDVETRLSSLEGATAGVGTAGEGPVDSSEDA